MTKDWSNYDFKYTRLGFQVFFFIRVSSISSDVRIIPHRKVDNNIGQKALPFQTTNQFFCTNLKVQTVHGASDIVAESTTCVYSYDAVNRTHHLPDDEMMHYVLSYYHGL